jgi:hypothetical protein
MITNRKFENAARSRRNFAFWAAVGLHIAAVAAVVYSSDLIHYLPDFIQELLTDSTEAPPPVVP